MVSAREVELRGPVQVVVARLEEGVGLLLGHAQYAHEFRCEGRGAAPLGKGGRGGSTGLARGG